MLNVFVVFIIIILLYSLYLWYPLICFLIRTMANEILANLNKTNNFLNKLLLFGMLFINLKMVTSLTYSGGNFNVTTIDFYNVLCV